MRIRRSFAVLLAGLGGLLGLVLGSGFVLRRAGYRDENVDVIPNNNKELFPTLEPRRERVATSSHRPPKATAPAQPPTPTPAPPTRRSITSFPPRCCREMCS